jgi:hypothetical protein
MLSFGILGSFSGRVEAKAEEARLGFGVSHIGPQLNPQISLLWKSSQSSTLQAHTGFSNESGNNRFDLGARFARNLFIEENQDFFFYMGASLNSHQKNSQNSSGYTLESGAGSEIFLSGLPNFGLNFSGGFALVSGGGTRIQTRVAFGMHYYF